MFEKLGYSGNFQILDPGIHDFDTINFKTVRSVILNDRVVLSFFNDSNMNNHLLTIKQNEKSINIHRNIQLLLVQASTIPIIASNTERIARLYNKESVLLYDHYDLKSYDDFSLQYDIQNVREIKLKNCYVVLSNPLYPNEKITFYSDVLYLNAYLRPGFHYGFSFYDLHPTRNTLEVIGHSIYDYFALADWEYVGTCLKRGLYGIVSFFKILGDGALWVIFQYWYIKYVIFMMIVNGLLEGVKYLSDNMKAIEKTENI